MDPLFLLALQQQARPAEVRIISQKAPAIPPGFTVTPQTPIPQIPPKSGVPLNPDLQKAMKAILPIIAVDADPPAVSDIAAAHSERYRNYMSEGTTSVPARYWENSEGTITVIDRAVKPDGSYFYYRLNAGHTMIHVKCCANPPVRDREVFVLALSSPSNYQSC
jgi:hypothetical protein